MKKKERKKKEKRDCYYFYYKVSVLVAFVLYRDGDNRLVCVYTYVYIACLEVVCSR